MKKTILVLLVMVTGISTSGAFQSNECKEDDRQRGLRDMEEMSSHSADYSQIIALKLATRKAMYRKDEMINIDMAILNVTNQPAYVRKPASRAVNIIAADETGKVVNIGKIGDPYILSGAIYPDEYELVPPNGILTKSYQLLVGCSSDGAQKYDQERLKLAKDVEGGKAPWGKTSFDRDLFISWGDRCLSSTKSGKYTISVEVQNNYVVLSKTPCASRIKTATGVIKSPALTITITD